MSREKQQPRKPATKFANLRKKMQKQKVQGSEAEEEVTMQHPAWTLIVIGVVIAGIGLVWLLVPSIPWLGKMPGDMRIERDNTSIYIPITTCILLSLILTGIMWLVRYFSR